MIVGLIRGVSRPAEQPRTLASLCEGGGAKRRRERIKDLNSLPQSRLRSTAPSQRGPRVDRDVRPYNRLPKERCRAGPMWPAARHPMHHRRRGTRAPPYRVLPYPFVGRDDPVAVPKILLRHLGRQKFDRCHSLTSLYLPLAALGSFPTSRRRTAIYFLPPHRISGSGARGTDDASYATITAIFRERVVKGRKFAMQHSVGGFLNRRFKLSFWVLLGQRPKVPRARKRETSPSRRGAKHPY